MEKKHILKRVFIAFFSKMIIGVVIAVLLGLMFGSFGSVILSRWGESVNLQQASSILRGRSECPHCKHRLYARDLIPLLSFLFQGWKCRYCHKKIARLYPILELGSAIIFGLAYRYLAHQGMGIVLFWTMTGRILWLLLIYDVLWYEVHIPLVLLGTGLLVFALVVQLFPVMILRGGLVFFLFFLLMYWAAKWMVQVKYGIKEEGVWFGDVLIAPYLGTLFYAGLPFTMITIDRLLAFLFFLTMSGGIGILRYLIQNRRYQRKATFLTPKMADQAVPFLPAMILGLSFVLLAQHYLFSRFGF